MNHDKNCSLLCSTNVFTVSGIKGCALDIATSLNTSDKYIWHNPQIEQIRQDTLETKWICRITSVQLLYMTAWLNVKKKNAVIRHQRLHKLFQTLMPKLKTKPEGHLYVCYVCMNRPAILHLLIPKNFCSN